MSDNRNAPRGLVLRKADFTGTKPPTSWGHIGRVTPISASTSLKYIFGDRVDQFLTPFFHIGFPAFLAQPVADALLELLENDSLPWQRSDRGLFALSTLVLDEHERGMDLLDMSDSGCRRLELDASFLFGVDVELVRPIIAHRFSRGDGLGAHSDGPTQGEDFRISLTLSRPVHREDGGHFVVLSQTGRQFENVLLRSHNTAVAFPLTAFSFHAVTCIHKIARYSVVFTFTRATSQQPPP